ncbi:DUF3037 domain-containing protein [Dokdonella immobilis]|uniref:DUF3037 domain-containing protein n=1 Tax=Dokdonella immobilis TaxID=578942 RepID=A0A1I4X8F5_9GAMM|nr:DUF3037 domain-containing protein [Dokdonella immobilis]SFN21962.1 Protein of unknown function [Dokdonella immobilis]
MPTPHWYDYAIVRVVPRPEREEFLNVGVILSCAAAKFLEARIELDSGRLLAFDPSIDLDLVEGHLATMARICAGGAAAGPIGRLSQRERFHWLVAPRSAVIQTSAAHSGRCAEPAEAVEHLLETMVRLPDSLR